MTALTIAAVRAHCADCKVPVIRSKRWDQMTAAERELARLEGYVPGAAKGVCRRCRKRRRGAGCGR